MTRSHLPKCAEMSHAITVLRCAFPAGTRKWQRKFLHFIYELKRSTAQAVFARLSPRRPGFDPRLVQLRFVVDKVALGHVLLRLFQFSRQYHSSIDPYLHLQPALTDRQTSKTWEPSRTQCSFEYRRALNRKVL